MVIHCRAGLHRTGVIIYLILRWAFDYSPNEATFAMEDMRPRMHREFFRRLPNRPEGLQPKAEYIFQELQVPH